MDISIGLYPNASPSEILATGQLADDLGFSTLWVADSHVLWREMYVLLGGLAATTSRIRLGSAVTNPITRHVTVTAGAFSTLSELSGGRAILGISVGDSALKTLGLKRSTVAALELTMGRIRQLLSGETVRFSDETTATLGYKSAFPLPIYIASTGPRMLDLAGRIADGVILMNGVAPDLIEAAISLVRNGAREAGRRPEDVKTVVWAACHASNDRSASFDAVKYNVARAILRPMPGQVDALAEATAKQIEKRYDYAQHGSAEADFAALVPDELVPRYAFAGSVDEVATQLEALREIGVDEVALAVPRSGRAAPRDEVIRMIGTGLLK
ncbi:MAG: LLM class flavin-dependent oxidoreductase [Hyphomicrobiales bacterium]